MHIPDGFINAPTSLGAGIAAFSGLGLAVRRAGAALDDKRVPMAGLVAAFVFAAQMLNFPVAVGTSGHLIGAVLAAVLVGPWVGALCLGVVLLVQALFADGGLTALGLNITNMALIGGLGGYGVFLLVRRLAPANRTGIVVASGVAAGLSVVLAAIGFVIEYAIGGAGGASIGAVTAAMVGVHLLIGVGEAVITAATVSMVLSVRPDLVYGAEGRLPSMTHAPRTQPAPRMRNTRLFIAGGLLVAVGLALFVSPWASSSPDGLEKVATEQGFVNEARGHSLADSPVADYQVEGVENERLSTAFSGLIGVFVTFGFGMLLFGGLRAMKERTDHPTGPA